VLEFLCPNGHRISCPRDQAGRAAKCPRCGVKFRIPDLADQGDASHAAGVSDSTYQQLADSTSATAALSGPVGSAEAERQIEFLCPNGHRLHGPASLQGKPGECPECGSRFSIPTYDEVSDDVEAEQSLGIGHIDSGEASGVAWPKGPAPVVGEAGFADTAISRTAAHPLASLFWKLWTEKPADATVKLHLAGGEIIVPDRFAKSLSQGSYGLFSRSEPDGTHTLTVVAWESVVRVQVQGVKRLPTGMQD